MREQRAIEQAAVGPWVGQRLKRFGRGTGRFIRQQPLGTLGAAVCIVTVFMAIFADVLGRYDPFTISRDRLLAPSSIHWFGTDDIGRDVYSRVVHGSRVSLAVSVVSIGVGTTFGYLVGIVSGYLGGKFDMLAQRVVDVMMAFPAILLALTLVAVMGAGLDKVIIAISVIRIPSAARVARGTVLSVRQNVYIDAARVIGASPIRIMVRHILPNVLAPFLIIATAALGAAILIEASLSYLGLGVPPPTPSWGRELANSAQAYGAVAPWLVIFPGAAIMLLVLAFNLFGDSLRDVWDPRLRGR